MKKLMLVLFLLVVCCNPFTSMMNLPAGGAANPILDGLMTWVEITVSNTETGLKTCRTLSISKVSVKNFLESQKSWIYEFEYNDGYAFYCDYITSEISGEKLHMEFRLRPINSYVFKCWYWDFELNESQIDAFLKAFPEKEVRNSNCFITFKN